MSSPYYDNPAFCALVCLLITAFAFGTLVAAWPRPRASHAARALTALLALGAFVPLAPVLALRTPRGLHHAPLGLAIGLGASALAVAGLRSVLAGVVALAGAAFAAAWSVRAPSSSGEALVGGWIVLAGALFAGAPRHLSREDPPHDSQLVRTRHALASPRLQDAAVALFGALVAAASVKWITLGMVSSGDEWALEYQAALFAKGHLYGTRWPCFDALRMYYVFWEGPRTFGQYQPGFPAFLALFVPWNGTAWVGVPVLSVCATCTCRIARRFANGPWRDAAGPLAGMLLCVSSAVVTMAGTRYPHLFVAACIAVTFDVAGMLIDRGRTCVPPSTGVVLGLAVGLCCATRAQDGVFGLAAPCALLAWLALRERASVAPLVLAAGIVVALVAACVVVMHAQTGVWFKSGYALNARIHPWNVPKYSFASFRDLRWHLPFVAGGATWLPLSPVLGVAGLVAARRNRPLAFAWLVSSAMLFAFYAYVELGRGGDNGPSPRYQFVHVVAMAVGGSLAITEILGRVHREWLARSLATGFALAAAASAVLVAPKGFAPMRHEAMSRNPSEWAARQQHLHHAIVYAVDGAGSSPPWDWPQNRPVELYEPDVVHAIWGGFEQRRCVETAFPHRAPWRVDHWDRPAVRVAPAAGSR